MHRRTLNLALLFAAPTLAHASLWRRRADAPQKQPTDDYAWMCAVLDRPYAPPTTRLAQMNDAQRRRHLEDEKLSEEEEKELDEKKIVMLKWATVVGLLALAATFVIGFLLEERHINWMPEAGVGILMGMLAASIQRMRNKDLMLAAERFDFEFFMIWLLPPIIFEAGFNMNVPAFFASAGPTMFFAFVGTFVSTFVVGGLVYLAGQAGLCYPMGILAALTFGSLISATDPVTVLAVFSKLGVKSDLFSMVFGESVLNDAVAIVLSRTLLSFNAPGATVDQESITAAGVLFAVIFLGSMAIGTIMGMLSAIVFKTLDLRHHDELMFMEAALSFTFPWAAYFIAEASELSGIVAILFCGIVMATYTRLNFSKRAITLTARAYKCIALVAETFIFVYLGMACITFPIFDDTVWMLFLVATGACFVGRLHIYAGSFLTNCFRGPDSVPPPISAAYRFVMWFSGLRGGVAFALASVSFAALDFGTECGGKPDQVGIAKECTPGVTDSQAILQTTMLIAVFTIFVFGGSITKVAVELEVLEAKGGEKKGEEAPPPVARAQSRTEEAHNILLRLLTNENTMPDAGDNLRYDATIASKAAVDPEVNWELIKRALKMGDLSAGPSTEELKRDITPELIESALRGVVVSTRQMTFDDKVDQLREAIPALSTTDLGRLLSSSGEDVQAAIQAGKNRAATGGYTTLL